MNPVRQRALEGALMGCIIPVGWLLLQLIMGDNPMENLLTAPGLYLYMLIGSTSLYAIYGYYLGRNEQSLEKLVGHDPVTQLHNRRSFNARLRSDLSIARRQGQPLGLIVLSLNHLELKVQRYGPDWEDHVLRVVAALLLDHRRRSDTVARIDQHRLAIILPYTDEPVALSLAEGLCAALANREIHFQSNPTFHLNVAAGVSQAERQETDSGQGLLERAENVLNDACAQGGNRALSYLGHNPATRKPTVQRSTRQEAPEERHSAWS